MEELYYDVAIIGGGPAGLAAALEAHKNGAKVAILERNEELGGILNQCIHSGFGLQYFKSELTGPEYAEKFIDMVNDTDIDVFLKTMVISLSPDKSIIVFNKKGVKQIKAKAVVLAMGCRERPRGAIMTPGTRPSGIFTAGQAQMYMNIENLKPGKKAVILGSGDIGLIMARRLMLEGIEVLGVYEIMPYPNGLYRNIKHCLEDFNIPLHLSMTVTNIYGNTRLEAVEVAKVDSNGEVIEGSEQKIECDTLLLSVGLIPENDLSLRTGVLLNDLTNGPVVNDKLETNIPGIFACGNALHVHDLVDNVTREAEFAGKNAALFAKEQNSNSDSVKIPIKTGKKIGYTVPNYVCMDNEIEKVNIFFRVRRPIYKGHLIIKSSDKIIFKGKNKNFKPNKMENINIVKELLKNTHDELILDIEEEV